MDYRIEKRDAFQVVCKRKWVGKPQSANATPDITAMWQEYGMDGTMGRLPDAFIDTYHRIVTEFFPQSAQYKYAENVEFEVYSSQDVSDPNYQCEIWIAVNEKTK